MTTKKRDIDPTVRRALGESAAHNAKARELLADLATSRGAVPPPAPEPNTDFEEELITARHDIEELKKAAKSSQLSVRAPGGSGFRVAGIVGWQIMVILVALGAIAAWAWVATHAITVATPVTQPAPPAAPAHS